MPEAEPRAEWTTAIGASICPGCDRGPIPAGVRGLRFIAGPRGAERLAGQWFHGFPCLEARAEELAWEFQDRDPRRSEGLRDLARWAQEQERRRRQAGRI